MKLTMRTLALVLGVASSLLLGGPAMSGEPAPAEEESVKVFNFEGDTISTDFLKPGTFAIDAVRRGRRSSLIEVRLDFVAEILRSAEDI